MLSKAFDFSKLLNTMLIGIYRFILNSFETIILWKITHNAVNAVFSLSVIGVSITLNSSLQPRSQFKDGGGLSLTSFQLLD